MDSPLVNLINLAEEDYRQFPGNQSALQVQGLIDLGYLDPGLLSDLSVNKKVEEAMHQFNAEMISSGLFTQQDLQRMQTIFGKNSGIKMLERLTAIDDGVVLTSLPRFGDSGLSVRILHYRLSLFGLYAGPAGASFNASSYTALEQISGYLNRSKLETINLLADIDRFTEIFLESKGYFNSIVVFRSPEAARQKECPEYKGMFKRRLKKDLENHPTEFEELEERIFHRRDDRVNVPFLVKRSGEEINRFILRLIQVNQWMAGHYDGALDADFGVRSFASLVEIIENFNETSVDKIKTEEVLGRVTGDYFLFNALYFLKQYQMESQGPDRTLETLTIISDSYSVADPDQQNMFESRFREGLLAVSAANRTVPVVRNGVIRRVFTGIRAFFRKTFRLARKFFHWVVNQVKHAATYISNAFRMIGGYLREALHHFIDGIRFLLGKLPVCSENEFGQCIVTVFDLGKDGLQVFGYNEWEGVKNHWSRVWKQVYSMQFSLAVIALLLSFIKTSLSAATLVAWPFFALNLAKAFKKVFDDFQKIQTLKTE